MRTLVKNVLLIDGVGNQVPNSYIDIVDNIIRTLGTATSAVMSYTTPAI